MINGHLVNLFARTNSIFRTK
uniref:Uncharacterized protein n=1 Tax=Oryza meridionalis TaxID=40149 RepID=A0A0E0DEH1_9ORYZ